MTDRELMQQALDVMEAAINAGDWKVDGACDPDWVLEALRTRLAQPEPVAIIEQLWGIIDDIDTYSDVAKTDDKLYRSLVENKQKDRWKTGITTDGYTLNVPLYTAPPQREWQGLTDEERDFLAWESNNWPECVAMTEAKLKEKNT